MATRPGVLIFGGKQVQGGTGTPLAVVTSTGAYPTSETYDLDFHRVVPDDATTGAPTASSLGWWPWFDGNFGTTRTIASSTSTTVTVSPNPGWTTNQWAGYRVTNNNATGFGFQNKNVTVISNTSDTLTVAAWTATPTVGTLLWLSEGRFTDYHPIGAWRTYTEILAATVPTRGGGSYIQGNQGIGYDAGLVRELRNYVWPVTPYFQIAKFATTYTTREHASAGAARTLFEAQVDAMDAAFALRYPTDTLEWQYVILDLSTEDVATWVAHPEYYLTYQADLTALVAYLRTTLGNASLRVLLVNHDHAIQGVSAAGGVGLANGLHNAVAALDDDLRILSLNGLGLPLRGTTAFYVPNENTPYYAVTAYARVVPPLMRRAIQVWEADGTTATPDGVMPVYILIGDSIEVGAISSVYSGALDSPTLTASARDDRQRVWNRNAGAIQAYHAHVNSQTSGSLALTTTAGPEFSLMVELTNRHPDTGFVLIKRASASSCLTDVGTAYDANENGGSWVSATTGEHWDELAQDYADCMLAINVGLGKQGELMGIFVGLGTNDGAFAGGGDAFEAALPGFVSDLRSTFGTHATGAETPIVWRKPQLGTSTADPDEMRQVRAALVAFAEDDAQFRLMDVDDLERDVDDNLHETPEACIEHGVRYDQELDEIALPNCSS